MVKIRLLHIILVFSLAIQAKADFLGYTNSHPLLFGIDMDYPPLEYIGEDGVPQGYDIQFTKVLMERMGIPFTYSPNTWENISGDVLSGRVDLGMMVYSPYRKEITNYSRAIFRLYYQIVYRKQANARFDVRHLEGKTVAYMASRPIKDTLTKAGAILHEVKNLTQATKDLSGGKYDAVICFRYQARYLLDRFQLKNLVTEDLTLTPREYCYVSHDKELIDSINVQLEKMEAEGIINDIYGVDITSSFGGFKIPDWVWYLLVSLSFLFLLLFIISQQRHQKRLRQEMLRAQRSEQLKTVFLGNVSHALRTPLNAIIGFSDVLDSDGGTMTEEDRHQLLKLINSNGRQLLYFINQLLKLSEIEGEDKLPIARVDVPLAQEMQSYADECRASVAKGVELRVEGEDITVRADERYMRTVTMNFLTNAIKHTKQGSIVLRYYLVNNGLQIEVQDTGEGLPEAFKENIFALLTEKATFVQDEVPGLGLTICKALVERCNGHIGAISPETGGTILWHWVPVKVVKP